MPGALPRRGTCAPPRHARRSRLRCPGTWPCLRRRGQALLAKVAGRGWQGSAEFYAEPARCGGVRS
eukprot:13434471-Heterocapsa_arctica.AAC.1